MPGVATVVVVYGVEPLKPVMQPTSLPFTEQLGAAAVVASSVSVTGIASSSVVEPMSSGVMMMPHRLPAAIHAFKHVHTVTNVIYSVCKHQRKISHLMQYCIILYCRRLMADVCSTSATGRLSCTAREQFDTGISISAIYLSLSGVCDLMTLKHRHVLLLIQKGLLRTYGTDLIKGKKGKAKYLI